MRVNQPATGRERSFGDDVQLISTTNLKGVITYANPGFVEVSGYSLDELQAQPHNIVRHPDMPEQAFADLWRHLKANKPWLGVVKNRSKNGDHYWVSAYVMPMFKNGEVVGYESVRTRPARQVVERAARITDMNVQVASAVEEQAAVAEEINRNISNISHSTEELTLRAKSTTRQSEDLLRLVLEMEDMTSRFAA